MAKFEQFFKRSTTEFEPIEHDSFTVTPVSQTLTFQIPHFQFSWNRPVEMRVNDGIEESRYPIHDVTRIAQLVIWTLGLFMVLLYWTLGRK